MNVVNIFYTEIEGLLCVHIYLMNFSRLDHLNLKYDTVWPNKILYALECSKKDSDLVTSGDNYASFCEL